MAIILAAVGNCAELNCGPVLSNPGSPCQVATHPFKDIYSSLIQRRRIHTQSASDGNARGNRAKQRHRRYDADEHERIGGAHRTLAD